MYALIQQLFIFKSQQLLLLTSTFIENTFIDQILLFNNQCIRIIIIFLFNLHILKMIKGTFVLSAYRNRNQQQKRLIDYRNTNIKYMVIVLAVAVLFCEEYCFDNPSALQEDIEQNYQKKHEEELGQASFNFLYAIYSLPNLVFPIIGGIMIDRIGARVVLVITAMLCVFGQFIFAYGGLENIFLVMLAGRFIFGLGAEVLLGSQNTIISNWFKSGQLSIVLGICVSFPKLGSALNSYTTPLLAKHFGEESPNTYENVGFPIFIGFFIMCIGLVLAIVLAWIDRNSENRQKILHQSALISSQYKSSSSSSAFKSPKTKAKRRQKSQLTGYESIKVQQSGTVVQESHGEVSEHMSFKDIFQLPMTYWILILIATLAEGLFIPFLDNGNKYYTTVFYGINEPEEAGIYLVMPYLVSAILVPIIGYASEKVKKRSYLLIASCLTFLVTYSFMLFLETSKIMRTEEWIRWIPTILLGISIAMFCTIIMPTVPMIVNPKLLGTAFGIMEVFQNLAMGVFPLIIGVVRERYDNQLQGFHVQTQFLFLVSCICVGASFFLTTADALQGGKMDVKDFRKKYVKSVLKEKQQDQED